MNNRPVPMLWGMSSCCFILMIGLVAGCGGGSGTQTSASDATGSDAGSSATVPGRAEFTVVWPSRSSSRLIPVAANSIRVDMLRGDTVIASQIVSRSETGDAATITFPNLPVDTLTARAVAYPQADGTGVAQASGATPIVIQSGQTATFSLTMTSTVDHLELTTVPATLPVGQQVALTATAWNSPDNTGSIVLMAAEKLQWSSNNVVVATVDSSGGLQTLTPGTAVIVVTDTESGKTATATVTVTTTPIPTPTPTPPLDPFAGVREYLALDLNNLPNYANPQFPIHYDPQVLGQNNTPPNNQVTNRGATLGRVLFNDRRLSINDTVSCASCHQQQSGMTDNRRFSVGFDGVGVTTTHGMRLGNIRFYTGQSMFWDKRAASVEAQATQPIQNSVEMGFDAAHGGFGALISKMQALPYYPELFNWVYGDPSITEDRVQRALAQFERSMVSVNSKFDTEFARVFNPNDPQRGIGTPFAGYTAQEERGKQLFLRPPGQGGAGCVSCHQAPTFALTANSRSNGLDAGETRIFKSPSLKNVAITGPYMHDGRFATLAQVVEHYNSGIQNGPALDNRLRTPNGQPLRLNLTAANKDDLVAFMRTLTDPSLTNDPKFSNPFIK